jgi:hypothetical protein
MDKLCVKCNTMDRGKDGRCKACHNAVMTVYRAKNKTKIAGMMRAYYYKITTAQLETMLESQGYCCGICGVSFTQTVKPYVDHNHACCPTQKTCGKCIRGLLCNQCNTVLGRSLDNKVWHEKALAYLSRTY